MQGANAPRAKPFPVVFGGPSRASIIILGIEPIYITLVLHTYAFDGVDNTGLATPLTYRHTGSREGAAPDSFILHRADSPNS